MSDQILQTLYAAGGAPIQLALLAWILFDLRSLRQQAHKRLTRVEKAVGVPTSGEWNVASEN